MLCRIVLIRVRSGWIFQSNIFEVIGLPQCTNRDSSPQDFDYTGVSSLGVLATGGAMAPPDFGRSVNPISTRGTDYVHLITTGSPGFSDLPTALLHRLQIFYSSQPKVQMINISDTVSKCSIYIRTVSSCQFC